MSKINNTGLLERNPSYSYIPNQQNKEEDYFQDLRYTNMGSPNFELAKKSNSFSNESNQIVKNKQHRIRRTTSNDISQIESSPKKSRTRNLSTKSSNANTKQSKTKAKTKTKNRRKTRYDTLFFLQS